MSDVVEFKRKDIEYILKKMFQAVGGEYHPDIVIKPDWFTMYEWTSEDEGKFKEWLIGYLKRRYKVGKKRATEEASWFLLNCGWKLYIETEATPSV